ncbi:unnamed protein product [Periconia digitata]|uniref:Uncharacterized protein n=1 Tax=Periconia digitata TaxID=1303443 RepID=A0A9W4XYB2_9PLEO|nr:unnamed protein product [Periconia digitata]
MPRYMTIHDLNKPSVTEHFTTTSFLKRAYSMRNTDSTTTLLRRLGVCLVVLIEAIIMLTLDVYLHESLGALVLMLIFIPLWLLFVVWALGRMELVTTTIRFFRLRLTTQILRRFIYAMIALHVAPFAVLVLDGIFRISGRGFAANVAEWRYYWFAMHMIITIAANVVGMGKEEESSLV